LRRQKKDHKRYTSEREEVAKGETEGEREKRDTETEKIKR